MADSLPVEVIELVISFLDVEDYDDSASLIKTLSNLARSGRACLIASRRLLFRLVVLVVGFGDMGFNNIEGTGEFLNLIETPNNSFTHPTYTFGIVVRCNFDAISVGPNIPARFIELAARMNLAIADAEVRLDSHPHPQRTPIIQGLGSLFTQIKSLTLDYHMQQEEFDLWMRISSQCRHLERMAVNGSHIRRFSLVCPNHRAPPALTALLFHGTEYSHALLDWMSSAAHLIDEVTVSAHFATKSQSWVESIQEILNHSSLHSVRKFSYHGHSSHYLPAHLSFSRLVNLRTLHFDLAPPRNRPRRSFEASWESNAASLWSLSEITSRSHPLEICIDFDSTSDPFQTSDDAPPTVCLKPLDDCLARLVGQVSPEITVLLRTDLPIRDFAPTSSWFPKLEQVSRTKLVDDDECLTKGWTSWRISRLTDSMNLVGQSFVSMIV